MVDWGKHLEAIKQSFIKLDPQYLIKNPVMFVVEIGTILTLILTFYPPFFGGAEAQWYYASITSLLLFTVLFANYAESLAELIVGYPKATIIPIAATTIPKINIYPKTSDTPSSSEIRLFKLIFYSFIIF